MRKFTKRYSSFGLAILILVNALSATLIYLDYELRKDFIAEVLCVNQDKPDFRCAGSCHLKKNLQKTQDAQTENPDKIQNFQFEFVTSKSVTILTEWTKIFVPKTVQNFVYSTGFYPLISFDFFHPPQV